MKSGLLGRKLGHSYSPQIHAFLGSYAYTLFEREPDDVGEFVRNGDFSGINVTIPYKKDVIPYLDEMSAMALRMGAVNTIVRREDGTLFGHNTDYFGFSSMVHHCGISVAGKKVLVLGSGGASNTAVKVLEDLGANVIIVSRAGQNNYQNLHLHADAAVIVNTTPLGMYPSTGVSPVCLTDFPQLTGVLDMIYNPARTAFLQEAEALGLPWENGLWMLVAQAKEAAEYFGRKPLKDSIIQEVYSKLSAQMQNIVLIGMPGSGKSTIGALLARKLGRELVDTDEKIVELAGKTIPQIFAEDGEAVFRDWETKVLEEYSKHSCLVITTGGGCVTQERNYRLLHQNSGIFWLKRNLDVLPTDGRPLSQSTRLRDMYRLRQPMYQRFADHVIDNNRAPEDTVDSIIQVWEGAL